MQDLQTLMVEVAGRDDLAPDHPMRTLADELGRADPNKVRSYCRNWERAHSFYQTYTGESLDCELVTN